METKGITCKIPLALHERVSADIREAGSTMSIFITKVISEHYEKGAITMANRTLAFQISEELFRKIKTHLARYEAVYGRKLTQREFVIGLIEQALEEEEENFRAVEQNGEVTP